MRRRTATVNGDDEVSARSAGDRVKHFLRSLGIGAGMEDAQLTADRLRVLRDALPWAMAARLVAGIALLLLGDGGLAPVLFAPLALMLAADAAYLFLGSAKRLSAPNPVRAMRLVTAYGFVIGACWGVMLLLPAAWANVPLAAWAAAAVITMIVMATVPLAVLCFALPLAIARGIWLASPVFAGLGALMVVFLTGALVAVDSRARTAARRRLAAECSARTARGLLTEFEDNERGWFWEIDPAGRLTYLSPQLARAIGQSPDALLGKPFTDMMLPDDAEQDMRGGERTLGFHLSARIAFSEIAVRAAVEGESRWWSLSGRPALDEYGNFLGFRGSGTDLTQRRASEREITRLARSDALTGLPNRIVIHQTLEASLRDVAGRPTACAVFLLDLDRFKNVNDTLGHPMGDALLRQVGERLASVVGEDGQVGRLGGDEFAIVLPRGGDRARLGACAQSVIDRISAPYVIEGGHIAIGATIGIAVAPWDGATADSLVRNADLALYAAKASGKGLFRFYEPEMHANAQDRQNLETDLRVALNEGGLHLAYQPIVDAAAETISGFEALMRWDHPTRGPVSPSDFVPIAEEIGLIPQIGEWVLRTACMEAARWPDPVRVAVNISPIQFASPALPALVMSALAAAGLAPHRLELEITEGVFLNGGDATDAMFAALKAIGVRFALDDFGTGYSSLGYLRTAPFDKIKIDQSFVRGAAVAGSRNVAIIKAIVSLAESLGMETTAEGAETHDELALIRSLGCSHIQGFIFGKPMLAEEARERARKPVAQTANGFPVSRAPRVAMLRSARLRVDGHILPVRVRNLSATGAMVEASAPLAPDSPVELILSDEDHISGAVRWARDGRAGIAFHAAFDVERFTSAGAPPSAARGTRGKSRSLRVPER